MAPTIRIGESTSTPTAPMSTAITSSATKLGDSPLSPRTRASTSSQITASDGSPGAWASAAAATSDSAVSMRSTAIEPTRCKSSWRSRSSTPLAASRATSNWTRSPAGRRAAPGMTTILQLPSRRSPSVAPLLPSSARCRPSAVRIGGLRRCGHGLEGRCRRR